MIHRKAFSLVELIISIALLGIIVVFLYSAVSNLQKSNEIFANNEKALSKKEKILDLVYDDIFSANDLSLTGIEFTLASMQTSSSLHDIAQPYVTWLVSKEKNTLLRFESVKKFENINSENEDYFHVSKVGENCEVFKIYQSVKKENILVHIKFKDQTPMIYEFAKPLYVEESNKTTSQSTSARNDRNQTSGLSTTTPNR